MPPPPTASSSSTEATAVAHDEPKKSLEFDDRDPHLSKHPEHKTEPEHLDVQVVDASSSSFVSDYPPSRHDPRRRSQDSQSVRSRKSRRSSFSSVDSRFYQRHLNDPNYFYPGSVDDINQNTNHIRWSRASDVQYPENKRRSQSQPRYEYEDDGMEYDDYWEDDSPYPEVRAAVANTDDPEMPTNTFRMWFIGIFMTILISGMNQFFYLRYPSVQISALVAQLIALPLGRAMERLLPTREWETFGYKWSLNPGPFNIKEHTLITIMANVVAGGAYATDIIAAQRTFYDQKWSISYQLCLVISTQLIGFAFAGICRRFLVWPASMIWPATLVNAALFNTMHSTYLDDDEEYYETEVPVGESASVITPSFEMQPPIQPDTKSSPDQVRHASASQIPSLEPSKSTTLKSTFSRLWVLVTFPVRSLGRIPLIGPFFKRIGAARADRKMKKSRNDRLSLFWKTLVLMAIWNLVPSYLFTALSNFTPLTWIFSSVGGKASDTEGSLSGTTLTPPLYSEGTAPTADGTPRRNIIINQLFGYTTGLGMGFLTFDWATIAYNGSPLVTPWWAELNVFATLVLIMWILAPALYYSNVFFSEFLPMSSRDAYDNTGAEYDSRRVVIDGVFDPSAYKSYSPLYISITFALSYGLSFASLTSTVIHTFLWYRHDIKRQFTSTLKDSSQEDVHARLMLAYPEVPQWWYGLIGIAATFLGIYTIEAWDTKLPFWAFILSVLISVVYLVPIGMIQAITNTQVGLNVITELIVGYALPGKPVAMMIFKTFGYITMTQALSFVSDLKLGHYMKIPPRLMFLTQTIAALIACFVVVFVQAWMFGNISGLCELHQPDRFTCPGVRVFSTASLIWGGIGPARAFNKGSLYYPLLFFFPIGVLLPIPFYFLSKKYPQSWFKYVNIPVCFSGLGHMPPASGINYSSWAAVGFIFQYWIRRRNFRWWSRFNYIFSAGLDSGVAVGTILVFFCLQYPRNGNISVDWWGNSVGTKTPDYLGTPLRTVAKGEFFGLKEWS